MQNALRYGSKYLWLRPTNMTIINTFLNLLTDTFIDKFSTFVSALSSYVQTIFPQGLFLMIDVFNC